MGADPLTPRPPDAKERPASPDLADAEYLCPNCLTPWKCNGPHIPQGVARADREAAPTPAMALVERQAVDARVRAAQAVVNPGSWSGAYLADVPALLKVIDRLAAGAALGVGEAAPTPSQNVADALDYLDAALDDTHPEGDECDICRAAAELREAIFGDAPGAAPTLDPERVARVFHDLGEGLFAVHDGRVEEPTCPLCEDRARRFLRGLGRS